jgi:hypothetical protein
MMIKNLLGAAAVAALILGAGQASAANNDPPPTGTIIHNFAGEAITHALTQYNFDFVATSAATQLSFAFREDPAFISLDNVSVIADGDMTNTNLVTNGDFEGGSSGPNTPTGWNYLNTFGATFAGVVTPGCGVGGSNCYYDGAVQAYDAINQQLATVNGGLYHLSFFFGDNSNATTFRAISDNGQPGTGGNGINMVVYGGDAIPVRDNGVPEPAAWALMLLGFGGMGAALRSRRRQAVTA